GEGGQGNTGDIGGTGGTLGGQRDTGGTLVDSGDIGGTLWGTGEHGHSGVTARTVLGVGAPCVPPLPEVQLKPRHRPLRLVRHWPELLLRFSLGSPAAIAQDEPCLQLRRNVFFPKSREGTWGTRGELLRLLYEEAREQLRGGRYPVDPPEAAELGGLSCRLRLGPFEPGRHTELSLRSAPAGPCPRDPHIPGYLSPQTAPRPTKTPRAPSRTPSSFVPRNSNLGGSLSFGDPGVSPPPLQVRLLPWSHRAPLGGLLGRGGLRPVSVAVGLEGVTIMTPGRRCWGGWGAGWGRGALGGTMGARGHGGGRMGIREPGGRMEGRGHCEGARGQEGTGGVRGALRGALGWAWGQDGGQGSTGARMGAGWRAGGTGGQDGGQGVTVRGAGGQGGTGGVRGALGGGWGQDGVRGALRGRMGARGAL
uniref:Uncharacterized protein n=1 Tax=Catharus ustulatus TaxID=91951 RepID=A0A8C3UUQ7_CATUS